MRLNSAIDQLVFSEAPENFLPKVEVVACFLRVADEFLFLHRHSHKSEGNRWGIPGGKIEKGESALQSVIREVQEETGLHMEEASVKYLQTVFIRYRSPKFDFVYHMFEYELQERFPVQINPQEHQAFRWLTLQDSLQLHLIQGEAECLERAYGLMA